MNNLADIAIRTFNRNDSLTEADIYSEQCLSFIIHIELYIYIYIYIYIRYFKRI